MKKFLGKLERIGLFRLIVGLFFIDINSRWIFLIITTSHKKEPLINIIVVSLFILISYILEVKKKLKSYFLLAVYFIYIFSIGIIMSLKIYCNPLNLETVFLYIIMSITGSFIWFNIVKKLKIRP